VRTAFNMLGPLLNPADAAYGLVGVYDTSISELMGGALLVRGGGVRGWGWGGGEVGGRAAGEGGGEGVGSGGGKGGRPKDCLGVAVYSGIDAGCVLGEGALLVWAKEDTKGWPWGGGVHGRLEGRKRVPLHGGGGGGRGDGVVSRAGSAMVKGTPSTLERTAYQQESITSWLHVLLLLPRLPSPDTPNTPTHPRSPNCLPYCSC
jgi:hypothetical protein